MPPRGDVLARGHYYHVYNRGAGRAPIFFNVGNYDYCLDLIARNQERYGVQIIAYCLMPNHYHLLLRQKTDVPLSRYMGVTFNTYVQAVNQQQGRTGTLFEGRYHHVRVDRDEYLLHLCRYIHLNPVTAKLVSRPEAWPYSNYREWIGQRSEILRDDEFIRQHFATADAYKRFVEDYGSDQRVRQQLGPYMLD